MAIGVKTSDVLNRIERNQRALRRILERNGRWLITVHNRQIVAFILIPPDEPDEPGEGEESVTESET